MSGFPRYDRLLVANRGEIAARVLRAARDLGLSTVAVYSDADRGAPYLALADDAVFIGPSPAAASYLKAAVLIEACKASSAGAVHPGYGFLSENSAFAAACEKAGLVFVGPPSSLIEAMSRKDQARRTAESAGLSVLPAAEGRDDAELVAAVLEHVGFPALIKAVAGGGGKAMHVVGNEKELIAALALARRESLAAFADPALMVERFVEHGRHVEVQVAADEAGHVVHLFERDCSVQRRHQKVIEEAPAPSIGADLRARLLSGAVRLAGFVGYLNLGTVEFLVAGEEAYFLEMNTRLQVEHRVTEAVTGVDLVRLQLEIAQGRPLGFVQADLACTGHAIEARLYAEDPEAAFLPQAGVPSFVRLSEHALVDAAVSEGRPVTTFYDPMLAKVVAAGSTRAAARDSLVRALDESAVFGVKTNLGFCRQLAASREFAEAAIDVNTLDSGLFVASRDDARLALAVAGWILAGEVSSSPLSTRDGWRVAGPPAPVRVGLSDDEGSHVVEVERETATVRCDDDRFRLVALERGASSLRCLVGGTVGLFHFLVDPEWVTVGYRGYAYRFRTAGSPARVAASRIGGHVVIAPMPGVVHQLAAVVGSSVRAGEVLAVLESMKMEFPLRSPRDGIVAEVVVGEGDHVGLDAPVVRLETQERSPAPVESEHI